MPAPHVDEVLEPGSLLVDKYRIERRIGEGGMGLVYAGTHEGLGTKIAIKVLHPRLSLDPAAHARFLREAQLAAQLESVHCADIYDVGTNREGVPFFVMEHLAGETLEARLAREGRLPVGDACTIVLQALDAISEAHHRGMVHRDVKPANLFLTQRLRGGLWTKVLDFGISKSCEPVAEDSRHVRTGPRTLLGSPAYMSPEQLRDSSTVDAATDTWALGVVLSEMINGVTPFRAEHAADLYALIVSASPPPPPSDVTWPGSLQKIVAACLSKDSRDRPPDATLAETLAEHADPSVRAVAERVAELGSRGGHSLPPPPAPPAPRRRVTVPVGAALVAVAGLAAFVAASTRTRAGGTAPRTESVRPEPAPALPVVPAAVTTPAASSRPAPEPVPAPLRVPKKAATPRIQTVGDIELLE